MSTPSDFSRVRESIESLGRERTLVAGFETKEGEDEGPYINFTFAAKDAARLWGSIQERVPGDPPIGATWRAHPSSFAKAKAGGMTVCCFIISIRSSAR